MVPKVELSSTRVLKNGMAVEVTRGFEYHLAGLFVRGQRSPTYAGRSSKPTAPAASSPAPADLQSTLLGRADGQLGRRTPASLGSRHSLAAREARADDAFQVVAGDLRVCLVDYGAGVDHDGDLVPVLARRDGGLGDAHFQGGAGE